MKKLTREEQMAATTQITWEMLTTKKNLSKYNNSWQEIYKNVTLPTDFFKNFDLVKEQLDAEYFKIDRTSITDKYQGVPLKRIIIGKKYIGNVNMIMWKNIAGIGNITFENNGNITFAQKGQKQYENIHYIITYNILSDDFTIYFINSNFPSLISINLADNILTSKYKNYKIIENIETGAKEITNYGIISNSNEEIMNEHVISIVDVLKKIREDSPLNSLIEKIDKVLKTFIKYDNSHTLEKIKLPK